MKFGAWYPLADAARHAPRAPGVFQVRLAEGLLDYPRGKSAMLHYAAADDVAAAALAFAAAHPGAPWWCRHTVEPEALATAEARALADRLVRDFRVRFGEAPALPPGVEGAAP